MKSPVKNLFGNRRKNRRKDDPFHSRDGLELDYPSSVMDKWRTDRRRRCRYAVLLLLSVIAFFTAFGVFMNMHAAAAAEANNEYGDRMVATSEFLTANEISTQQALVDRNSPQSKAARWIANQDAERLDVPETSEDPYRFIQRYAVAVLYYSLGGDIRTSQLNFLSDDHECSWNEELPDENNELFAVGVSCDANLHIDSLLVPSNNLQGAIPDEIRYLDKLKFISLKHNELSGEIPSALRELTMLEYLDFKYNQMEGTIPDFVGELAHLQVLGLSRNKFVGSLPPSLGTLRLRTLAVDDNALTGDLSTIRLMTPLKYLYGQNNSFTGNIFHGILMSQLPSLVEIDLSDNDLTAANIPSHIFTLPALRLFDASGNNITGTLPNAIPQNNVLEYLSFRGNTIGSSIPATISNLRKLSHLDLENNSLFGALPFTMGSMTSLHYLFLGKNFLETGAISGELKELTALKELSLNNLGLKSEIPDWIGGLSHLTLLDLRENEFSGSIQQVDFSKLQRLEYLLLNDNKLTGPIPESLALIKSLKVLSLYHNSFTGSANPVCDSVSDIAWLGTDCSDDITCDCCDQCCSGGGDSSCYSDAKWDELENNRWDHEFGRASYAFNPNILNGGIQPRDGAL